MKILLGISYYHPNISGLSQYAKTLSEELVKRNHTVKILTSRYLKSLPKDTTIKGVEVERAWTPMFLGRGPIMPTYALIAIKKVKWSNVVNIHTPQFEGFILALLAKLFGKKLIITHQCDLSNRKGLLNQITEKATWLSLFITCKLADKIVVLTKDYADNSTFLRRFKNKIVYVYPPVKIITKDNKKDSLLFDRSIYKIGFVGRITQEKGIQVLLNSISYLKKMLNKNFKIFIVGPDKQVIGGSYKKQINPLLEKYKKHVKYLGVLKQNKMAQFYKELDVLTLPSVEKIEALGLVQIEAMLCGCPVVASKLPGVRVPVQKTGMGEISNVNDPKDLAIKIARVISQRSKYTKNKSKIKYLFNFEKTIDYYEHLFSQQ